MTCPLRSDRVRERLASAPTNPPPPHTPPAYPHLAGKRWMPLVTKAYLLVTVGSFVYFSPWIYSLPLTPEGHARRRWLSSWD